MVLAFVLAFDCWTDCLPHKSRHWGNASHSSLIAAALHVHGSQDVQGNLSVMTMIVMTVTMMPDDHSKKARLGPLEGRPLGGVGGRSSLMAAIQVSFMGCGVGGSSSASSLLSLALMAAEELGGRG